VNERWKISYVCVYINAAVKSVMLQLYLRRDSCNIIFENMHKFYVAPLSGTPVKNSVCAPVLHWHFVHHKAHVEGKVRLDNIRGYESKKYFVYIHYLVYVIW